MKILSPTLKQFPLTIAGSTKFGRYPKIALEQTFNMIISDDWLVPYSGYSIVAVIRPSGQGRGIYGSTRFNNLIVVIDNTVYSVSTNFAYTTIGTLNTSSGDVFIAENNDDQIAICDKKDIWIFNYSSSTFEQASIPFTPGYIEFQDSYFISVDQGTSNWYLSDNNNGLSWPIDSSHTGEFQTKPDILQAVVRIPGKGGRLFVMGHNVTEPWQDIPSSQLFPYQRDSSYNIDYGTINAATIATNDKLTVWLGSNEKSGPVIMFSNGGDPETISNDGINFRLSHLTNPEQSYGFLMKQDGHIIYQITFYNEADNLSLAFDFTTQKIFTVTDQYMNFHIAKRVAFFNNSYFFVSLVDGNLYELNSNYTTYGVFNGQVNSQGDAIDISIKNVTIPRIRVDKTLSMPDRQRFVVQHITFPIEQGQYSDLQAVDFSMSKNGGQSFGSYERKVMNTTGYRQNRLDFWNKGMANEFIPQFRFWGLGRFVATDGVMSIYQ